MARTKSGRETTPPATGHANRHGAVRVTDRPGEHVEVLLDAGGREVGEPGQGAEHGDVEEAEVRDVGGAKGRGAKDEDGRRGVVQAEVVPELVVGALQEGGIDAQHGSRAAASEAGYEADGVLLGDAHVDEAPARALAQLRREAMM